MGKDESFERLSDVGLVKGDGHFTEDGNEVLSDLIFRGLQ